MPVDLPSLLLPLPDGDDPTLWAWVESEYRRLYVGTGYRGNRSTHDGQAVSFFFDRAEHAFRQSTDYQRHPTQKTEIARGTDRAHGVDRTNDQWTGRRHRLLGSAQPDGSQAPTEPDLHCLGS